MTTKGDWLARWGNKKKDLLEDRRTFRIVRYNDNELMRTLAYNEQRRTTDMDMGKEIVRN